MAFIREVCGAPEMHVFLCNNWQLNDIKCSYTKHLLLLAKQGRVEQAMIGLLIIHQTKIFQSYHPLRALMVKFCPELKNLKAVGTNRNGI